MKKHNNKPAMLLLFLGAAALLFLVSHTAAAREIEATHEWTLLGENDTVAAGMHIRMDLQTGQKWVKLPDDEESNKDAKKDAASSKQQQQEEVEITAASGGLVIRHAEDDDAKNKETKTASASTDNNDDDDNIDMSHYDFEMMHRTLSKLPVEEQEQMQLPQLPPPSTNNSAKKSVDRKEFERRMATIWKQRQAALRQVQEEMVADLPAILLDRLQRLKQYLQQPAQHLHELVQKMSQQETNNDNDDVVTDIVSVLKDVEYHLTDVDMTRDFITMGGWPLLVQLVSDEVHADSTRLLDHNKTNSHDDENNQDLYKAARYSIQAHAAWALGTAVKNTPEFHPYALQPVQLSTTSATSTTTTTAIDLLLQQYVSIMNDADSTDATTTTTAVVEMAARTNCHHKLLYALASLLRGNRPALVHFAAVHGPDLLAQQLIRVTNNADGATTNSRRKTMQRLLSLAQDIVLDVQLHPAAAAAADVDAAIVQGFSSQAWCTAVVQALQFQTSSSSNTAVTEQALKTLQTVGPNCQQWNDQLLGEALQQVQDSFQATADHRDADVQQELLKLVASIREQLL